MRLVVKYDVEKLFESENEASPILINFLAKSSVFSDPDFWDLPSLIRKTYKGYDSDALSKFFDLLRVIPISAHSLGELRHAVCIEPKTRDSLEAQVNELAHEDWPKGVLPGERADIYDSTVKILASLANKILIIDPFLGEKVIKSPGQLWLLNRIVEDSNADITLVTRNTEFLVENNVSSFRMERAIDSLLKHSESINNKSLKMKVYATSKYEFHNRAIRFVFDNGVSSDHSLEKGVELFASKKIVDSDLPFMSPRQFEERLARFQKYALGYEVFQVEQDGRRFWVDN